MEFSIPRPTMAEPPARLYIPVKAGMMEDLQVGKKAKFLITGQVIELSVREYEGKQRHEVCLEVTKVRSPEKNDFAKMAEEEG